MRSEGKGECIVLGNGGNPARDAGVLPAISASLGGVIEEGLARGREDVVCGKR